MGSEVTYLDKLKFILELSNVAAAQYFAALCIKGIISTHWNKIETKTKMDFKVYLMNYLANKATTLNMDTIKALIQCLIYITKLAWFDDPGFKEIVGELQTFASFSYNHKLIAFMAYDSLIQEMSYFNKGNLRGATIL